MCKTVLRNLILPKPPETNRHSRELLHAAQSYDMDAMDSQHHENPVTWAGNEPAISGTQGQQQTNYATQLPNINILYYNVLEQWT
ncbi:hypothetical protein TNCV_4665301 [Trichonephila clavipes]|nr:hypothetical protein TNCV_4665301 [Trichonephila clavipes]